MPSLGDVILQIRFEKICFGFFEQQNTPTFLLVAGSVSISNPGFKSGRNIAAPSGLISLKVFPLKLTAISVSKLVKQINHCTTA